ncbi:MAG: hypothetical protein ACR2QQ_12660 [Gammaproteobacteria bacterium]
MFIGHFALAFGAKKFAPNASLGILFLACQFADLLWPNLVLLGVEQLEIDPGNTLMTPLNFLHYPFSHSLVSLLLWAALLAGSYALLAKTGARVATVVGLLVVSHWVLDVITHRPDMPIALGESARIGFGLWNAPLIAVALELALMAAGVWLYLAQTTAKDRIGTIGLWSLVIFLLIVYTANLLGPPPPSATAVAWSAQAMWLIVAWGYWVDSHRISESSYT